MEIERLLVIPRIGEIEPYVELAREYGCGFEYNDFFSPAILDNEQEMLDRIETYKAVAPSYTTLHGAFLDINICSADSLIREASDRRVRQCIEAAIALEARGVVFHTNFIANFNQTAYKEAWVSDNVTYWKNILAEY